MVTLGIILAAPFQVRMTGLSHFSCCVTKHPARSSLREEGLTVAHSIRECSLSQQGMHAWLQKPEAAGQVASIVRKKSEQEMGPASKLLVPPHSDALLAARFHLLVVPKEDYN